MYVLYIYRNNKARSRNYCCHGTAVSTKNCVCLYSYLSYPAANRFFSAPYFIAICDQSGPTLFFHIIS
jgi:hypothetical protein